jgi:hypothetical protein
MGVIFDTLAKSDSNVRNCTEQAPTEAMTKAYRKSAYPTGHDTTTEMTSAEGTMSGDASAQDQDEGEGVNEVNLDATLLDQKVRELVQSAGAKYNYKAARAAGMAKRADPELLAAAQRLEKNAALLNRAVELTNLRKSRLAKRPWDSGGMPHG